MESENALGDGRFLHRGLDELRPKSSRCRLGNLPLGSGRGSFFPENYPAAPWFARLPDKRRHRASWPAYEACPASRLSAPRQERPPATHLPLPPDPAKLADTLPTPWPHGAEKGS